MESNNLFTIKSSNKKCQLSYAEGNLEILRGKRVKTVINVATVLSIKEDEDLNTLTINYARQKRKNPNIWRLKTISLKAETREAVKSWAQTLGRALDTASASSNRPRRLLAFVNPGSGRGRARRVWHRCAAPVFAAAGVSCDVLETERSGHAAEVIAGRGLEVDGVDGVVAVGGDGMANEVAEALLRREAKRRGTDIDEEMTRCAIFFAYYIRREA